MPNARKSAPWSVAGSVPATARNVCVHTGSRASGRTGASPAARPVTPEVAGSSPLLPFATEVRPRFAGMTTSAGIILRFKREPTLVLNREHDPAPGPTGRLPRRADPGCALRRAERIGARAVAGSVEPFCAEVAYFITGVRPAEREPGAVRAILHCDIVDSTSRAAELGNERWTDLLADYGHRADLAVAAHAGRVVDRTGDGLMAAFEGPVAAIRAARRLQQDTRELERCVRAGVHMREVLQENGHRRGIAVFTWPPG
jgi:hypothetical protein